MMVMVCLNTLKLTYFSLTKIYPVTFKTVCIHGVTFKTVCIRGCISYNKISHCIHNISLFYTQETDINISFQRIVWFDRLVPYYPKALQAYKHVFYPGYKHMCLYPVDIYQSVTKSLRFRITVILLLLSQITVALATFSLNYIFCLLVCLKYRISRKLTQNIKILEIKW